MSGGLGWRPDWAKGLTAATDPRVAKMAASRRGIRSWARGLTAADHPSIARQAETRRGRPRGPYKRRLSTAGGLSVVSMQDVDPIDLIPFGRNADYAYLFGLYLGDGSIADKHHRLEISLDSRQPEIIESCAAAMRTLHPRGLANIRRRKNGSNCDVVNSYAWQWLVLFPQHGAGRKHLRKIELRDWQRLLIKQHLSAFLRGLIESDGSRFDRKVAGKAYPAYEFVNRSTDIIQLFCWAADLFGVHYTLPDHSSVSIARRADVARLDLEWPVKMPARSGSSPTDASKATRADSRGSGLGVSARTAGSSSRARP